MTLIESIKTYLTDFSSLKSGAPIWVNYLGEVPTEYSVVPLPGSRIIETYIDGSSLREFPFAFQSSESTADDLERLETMGFFEAFADWLEDQTKDDDLPTLGSGQTATEIEATGWAYLYQQGESATGIYQIQCRLVYEQENQNG